MNAPTTGKTATVKDIAEATGASERTIRDVAARVSAGTRQNPGTGGRPHLLFTELETARISHELKKAHNADPVRQSAVTALEMEMRTLEVILWHQQKIGELEAQNNQLAIKADVADTIAESDGLILLSDAGKQICGHPLKFIQWALDSGLIFRRKKGGPLLPKAEYDKKYFRLTSRSVDGELREQVYLTPAGLTWITGKYNAHHYRLNLQGGAA